MREPRRFGQPEPLSPPADCAGRQTSTRSRASRVPQRLGRTLAVPVRQWAMESRMSDKAMPNDTARGAEFAMPS